MIKNPKNLNEKRTVGAFFTRLPLQCSLRKPTGKAAVDGNQQGKGVAAWDMGHGTWGRGQGY